MPPRIRANNALEYEINLHDSLDGEDHGVGLGGHCRGILVTVAMGMA
jgi:hypothetical protein